MLLWTVSCGEMCLIALLVAVCTELILLVIHPVFNSIPTIIVSVVSEYNLLGPSHKRKTSGGIFDLTVFFLPWSRT